MLVHEGETDLGLHRLSPEVSMYRSLLLEGGFHQPTGQAWSLGAPRAAWQPLWQAIDEFLSTTHGGARPLSELMDVLRRPPFGLREGPIPVLLCAAFLARRHDMALYEDGVFVPELRIEVFERLTRGTRRFCRAALRLFSRGTGGFRRAGGDVAETWPPDRRCSRSPAIVHCQTAGALPQFGLPAYSKSTRRLQPPQAAAVRDDSASGRPTLRPGSQPISRQAAGLPTPLDGYAPLLAVSLKDCIIGLQEAYPRLLADIEQHLAEAFDLHGGSQEMAPQLEARAIPLVGQAAIGPWPYLCGKPADSMVADWREV